MQHTFRPILTGWLVLATCLATRSLAQDVGEIFMFKAVWYEQTSAAGPELIPMAEEPYDITISAYLSDELLSDPEWWLWVTGMTVRTPGGRTEGLTPDFDLGSFEFYEGATSQQALNTRYAPGNYRVSFMSVITGESRYDVPLAADDYPPPPQCTNFAAAQKVDPTRDFTLRWAAFTGEGEREIWLHVTDPLTGEFVFYAGPLDGTETAIDIPAGMLTPNTLYTVWLSFTRYTHIAFDTVPETYSGFDAYNSFPLRSISGGTSPDPAIITGCRVLENGDLELTATCTPDRPLTVAGSAQLDGSWSNLQTDTPADSPVVLVVPKAALGNRLFLRLFQE